MTFPLAVLLAARGLLAASETVTGVPLEPGIPAGAVSETVTAVPEAGTVGVAADAATRSVVSTLEVNGVSASAETPRTGLEVRVCALVEARAAAWPEVPPEAVIDIGALSWRRAAFLAPGPGIPIRSPEVKRALAAALAPLPASARTSTVRVLTAVGRWVAATLFEDPGPLTAPSGWRAADEVLRSGHGNAFELVRVLVALLRAAGIPAKPSFNGVPVVVLFAAPTGVSPGGEWTVWDPLHPSGSFRLLPVAWLPLRAGDIPLVRTVPAGLACRPSVGIRRYATREEAARAWETAGRIGSFPSNPAEPLAADTRAWWEVWILGVAFDDDPGRVVVTVPLPFVPELRTGTRDQKVWASDSARVKSVDPVSETDQRLGGLTHGFRVRIGPSRVDAARGALGSSPSGEQPRVVPTRTDAETPTPASAGGP